MITIKLQHMQNAELQAEFTAKATSWVAASDIVSKMLARPADWRVL